MRVWEYLVLKWTTLLLALLAVGAAWFWTPTALITVFDWNTLWIGGLWSLIKPYLPAEASIPLEAVQQVYSSLVILIHNITKLLPEELTAQRAEAAARGFLGEGWIVVVEIAIILRLLWLARRLTRKPA